MTVKKCEYCSCKDDDVDTIDCFSGYNLKIPEQINICEECKKVWILQCAGCSVFYRADYICYTDWYNISAMENVFFCDNCVRLWQEHNYGKNIVNMIEETEKCQQ